MCQNFWCRKYTLLDCVTHHNFTFSLIYWVYSLQDRVLMLILFVYHQNTVLMAEVVLNHQSKI